MSSCPLPMRVCVCVCVVRVVPVNDATHMLMKRSELTL